MPSPFEPLSAFRGTRLCCSSKLMTHIRPSGAKIDSHVFPRDQPGHERYCGPKVSDTVRRCTYRCPCAIRNRCNRLASCSQNVLAFLFRFAAYCVSIPTDRHLPQAARAQGILAVAKRQRDRAVVFRSRQTNPMLVSLAVGPTDCKRFSCRKDRRPGKLRPAPRSVARPKNDASVAIFFAGAALIFRTNRLPVRPPKQASKSFHTIAEAAAGAAKRPSCVPPLLELLSVFRDSVWGTDQWVARRRGRSVARPPRQHRLLHRY